MEKQIKTDIFCKSCRKKNQQLTYCENCYREIYFRLVQEMFEADINVKITKELESIKDELVEIKKLIGVKNPKRISNDIF